MPLLRIYTRYELLFFRYLWRRVLRPDMFLGTFLLYPNRVPKVEHLVYVLRADMLLVTLHFTVFASTYFTVFNEPSRMCRFPDVVTGYMRYAFSQLAYNITPTPGLSASSPLPGCFHGFGS